MTLTEFLLARIAEDEAAARLAAETWPVEATHIRAGGRWVALYSPARILAECEAKRRIIELHEQVPETWGSPEYYPHPTGCILCSLHHDHFVGEGDCDTLKALALPYAAHPDCREDWK